jgi:nucleoside-diphosphate-sugar epimerase
MPKPVKVAILGGSGFMGYNLCRALIDDPRYEPVVYSTGAKNLANLSRHDVDLRLVRYSELAALSLDADVRFLINFAHPFGNREALSIESQVDILAGFTNRNLRANPDLRAIQISSMSVYEPFASGVEFAETASLQTPRSDRYAGAKHRFERRLTREARTSQRLMILRPTVVYGPFCRPWTDALLSDFGEGDVEYFDLDGRIQPLFVDDVSRFVCERLEDFRPGVFNLAGPDKMTWSEYLAFHEGIVDRGRLVRRDAEGARSDGPFAAIRKPLMDLARANLREPALKDLARPIVNRLPASWSERLKARVKNNLGPIAEAAVARRGEPGRYCSDFFAEDRLVSMASTREEFPDLQVTSLDAVAELMARYHRFRFSDEVLT